MATLATPSMPLRALKTQVGGHFMILEIDKQWICKPMLARETFFYENLPDELKQFTPKYKGLIKVYFSPDKDGRYIYTAYPIQNDNSCSTSNIEPLAESSSPDTSARIHSYVKYHETERKDSMVCSLKNIKSHGTVTVLSSSDYEIATEGDSGVGNPWTEFRMKQMNTMLDERVLASEEPHKHIILENLTGKYKHPCVVDLKLGTRTYSDIMSDEKKQKHSMRCASTTSGSLGVRLGGMQLYSETEGKYYLMDKYYGHSLNEKSFYKALKDFLCKHENALIAPLLEKLKHLREVIIRLESYRLFASSLLIMYEGAAGDQDHMTNGGVITHEDTCSDDTCSNPLSKSHSESHRESHLTNGVHTDGCSRSDIHSKPLNISKDSESNQLLMVNRGLDVRMIDFCNVTNEHFTNDPISYSGPDEGYLKGLTTIIDFCEGLMTRPFS